MQVLTILIFITRRIVIRRTNGSARFTLHTLLSGRGLARVLDAPAERAHDEQSQSFGQVEERQPSRKPARWGVYAWLGDRCEHDEERKHEGDDTVPDECGEAERKHRERHAEAREEEPLLLESSHALLYRPAVQSPLVLVAEEGPVPGEADEVQQPAYVWYQVEQRVRLQQQPIRQKEPVAHGADRRQIRRIAK